jgi:hypothetical protein
MVLRSLHRLTPQALRPSLEVSKKRILIFLVDSRVGLPIALSSFPGLPIFLPRCEVSQTLVLGFMSPSSRVGH